jgi:hypothetical protein
MPKIGRNDPCPCGSGKKYKHCHLPLEEAKQAEDLRMRRAVDTLLPKIITAAQEETEAVAAAYDRFWNGKYTLAQMSELDDLEGRGAERFLTWFAFDYPLAEGGATMVERLAADGAPDLTPEEQQLLGSWAPVRLRPYVVTSVQKGQGMAVADLVDGTTFAVVDHAASRRVLQDEVLVAHLLPAGESYFIGGAAAHLTEDTREKLREFAGLYLEALQRERPDASWADLLRERSEVLNHFVMQLPVEEPNPTLLENIIAQTRASLMLAGESLGIGKGEKDSTADE